MKTTKPFIGAWVKVTGHPRFSASKWRESFPQDLFGRIIELKKLKRITRIVVRSYGRKRKGEKHPHLDTYEKHIKILKP